jgi:hypothetical protein
MPKPLSGRRWYASQPSAPKLSLAHHCAQFDPVQSQAAPRIRPLLDNKRTLKYY